MDENPVYSEKIQNTPNKIIEAYVLTIPTAWPSFPPIACSQFSTAFVAGPSQ